MFAITLSAACAPSEAPLASNQEAATGTMQPALTPVDQAMQRFVDERCVGAAVLGISYNGNTVLKRGYGFKDGAPNAACAAAVGETFKPSEPVSPNTAMRIGSISKSITAAILRLAVKQRLTALGRPATDADVEAVSLLHDPDLELVSSRVRQVLIGAVAPPFEVPLAEACVHAVDKEACLSMDANPCADTADPRWNDMTLGDLLSHRAGLPRSPLDLNRSVRLHRVRGWPSKAQYLAWHLAEGPTPLAEQASSNMVSFMTGYDPEVFFIPMATSEDYLVAESGRCLRAAPGSATLYSNLGFSILGYVVEHLTGTPLSAQQGDAASHEASLLHLFNAQVLGKPFGLDSEYGVFMSQSDVAARDPSEPRYRSWSAKQGTYYPELNDPKRPYCAYSPYSTQCDLDVWNTTKASAYWTTPNWAFDFEKVGVSYSNTGVHTSAGLLAVESGHLLRFLDEFWLGAQGTSFYGLPRDATNPSASNRFHSGALAGTFAHAAQFVGAPQTFRVFPAEPTTGRRDFGSGVPSSCRAIPDGVNLFVAVNQGSDHICGDDAGKAATGSCGTVYNVGLRDVLIQALCEVDWRRVPAFPLTAPEPPPTGGSGSGGGWCVESPSQGWVCGSDDDPIPDDCVRYNGTIHCFEPCPDCPPPG